MNPLLASGRSRIDCKLVGGAVPSWITNLITGSVALRRFFAGAALVAGVTVAGVASAAGTSADSELTGGGITPAGNPNFGEVSVVSVIAPAAVPAPAGLVPAYQEQDSEYQHWTLRGPKIIPASTVVPVSAESSGSTADFVPTAVPLSTSGDPATIPHLGRAEVSMFSWRDIVIAVLFAAFALGALFAFTRGGEHHTRRY